MVSIVVMSNQSPFRKTLRDLAEVSTVHGLRYALNFQSHLLDRLLWTLMVVIAMGLGVYTSAQLYLDWQNDPVTTTIGTVALPITDIDFPAITLCSPGNDMKALYKLPDILSEDWHAFWNTSERRRRGEGRTLREMDTETVKVVVQEFLADSIPGWPKNLTLEKFLLHMTTDHEALAVLFLFQTDKYARPGVPDFDILFNPERLEEKEQALRDVQEDISTYFRSLDLSSERAHRAMMAALWFTGHPCSELMAQCKWKGAVVPCSAIFHLVPTDIGFCCSFNHDPLVVMLRNSSFARILTEIEERYKAAPDAEGNVEAPCDAECEKQIKAITPQAGKQNGLQIILDMKSHVLSDSSVKTSFHGIQASVTPKNTFPLMHSNSFLISPGRVTHVEITAKQTSGTAELRDRLNPHERNCYFADEYYLQLFSDYSMANCWMECLMNLSRSREDDQCFPWNFPTLHNVPCKPLEQHRFIKMFTSLDMNKIIGTEICRPLCSFTEFRTSLSTAEFRPCDGITLGLSDFCDPASHYIQPQMWADEITAAYEKAKLSRDSALPAYLRHVVSPTRLEAAGARSPYNAFERDIAQVNFFFSAPAAVELVSSPTMTVFEFASSVGGLLGLFVGFSLLSVVEIVYWFTIGYGENAIAVRKMRKISVASASSSAVTTISSAFSVIKDKVAVNNIRPAGERKESQEERLRRKIAADKAALGLAVKTGEKYQLQRK